MNYTFDPNFQQHILASFLQDKKFLSSNLEILNPEYFSEDILQGIAECVRDFFEEHKDTPSKEVLLNEIKHYVSPGRKTHEYTEEIEAIFEKLGVNTEYYQNKSVEFAKTRALNVALTESLRRLEQGELDSVGMLVKDAMKVGEGFEHSKFYDYFNTLKERAITYLKFKTEVNPEGRIPTGFSLLDERIQGGLGRGETGIIVAPPKHGKTTALINLAIHALSLKLTVLYITLDLRKATISSKFDSYLYGNTLDEIKKKPKSFYEKVKEKIKGRLIIVEYPTKSLTVPKLQSIIEEIHPDVVFVDYVSVMRSLHRRGEKRFELTDLHEGMRNVAGELNVPIWSAHQSNKPGFESKIIDLSHLAEDFNIGAIHDVLISVNQSNEERRMGKVRLYIMGNRLGASEDIIECDANWGISQIKLAFGEKDGDLE